MEFLRSTTGRIYRDLESPTAGRYNLNLKSMLQFSGWLSILVTLGNDTKIAIGAMSGSNSHEQILSIFRSLGIGLRGLPGIGIRGLLILRFRLPASDDEATLTQLHRLGKDLFFVPVKKSTLSFLIAAILSKARNLSQQSASQKSNQRIINRGLGVISGP
jgi:hypothetical protein